MNSHVHKRANALLAICMLLCVVFYLPGLKGGYLFDDYPNIVDNPAIHMTTLDADALQRAFWAAPASGSQRPLATLSFAVNHYFTGLAPQPMKATNLAIHLVNGWLLYLLLGRILHFFSSGMAPGNVTRGQWVAALIAGVWLLHPINLSAVLFVVQRMEGLALIFVLLGLLLYVNARMKQTKSAEWCLWIGFPVCLLLGMAAKESAALLPLYALLLECIVFRGASAHRRKLILFHVIFLLLPLLAGLAWLVPKIFSEAAYSTRHFTLLERLMTEPRVLVDYALWTVLPLPQFAGFYHDDYPVSVGLTTPWTTLPAMLVLLAAVVMAWKLRYRRPLTSLGLAWFLAAHAMTATVIPLELVFEHRNYFASAGLLLALFDMIFPVNKAAPMARVGHASVAVLILLAVFSLNIKARTWGNPVLFAVTEAARSPQSPRATYELGRTYALLSGFRADSPNLERAISALEAAAAVPRASAMPESTLIIASSKAGIPIKPEWWNGLIGKLISRTPNAEDIGAIMALTNCRREGHCAEDDEQLTRMYRTALAQRRAPEILYGFAIHAHNAMGDTELALELAREAAKHQDLQYHVNLVGFLIALGKTGEAHQELEALERRDHKGSMVVEIGALHSVLKGEK